MPTETVTNILSVLTLLGQIALFALVLALVAARLYAPLGPMLRRVLQTLFAGKDVAFAFLIAVGAVAGSLYFSEIAGFAPCVLCWYQRIAIYPSVVILGMEMGRAQVRVRAHVMILTAIGFVIAAYQNLIQYRLLPPPACTTSPFAVSCTATYAEGFGYITIPMMSLTAFALMLAILGIGAWLEKTKITPSSN